jgi:hypothetical protein
MKSRWWKSLFRVELITKMFDSILCGTPNKCRFLTTTYTRLAKEVYWDLLYWNVRSKMPNIKPLMRNSDSTFTRCAPYSQTRLWRQVHDSTNISYGLEGNSTAIHVFREAELYNRSIWCWENVSTTLSLVYISCLVLTLLSGDRD